MGSNKQKRALLAVRKSRKSKKHLEASYREAFSRIDLEGHSRGLAPIDTTLPHLSEVLAVSPIPTYKGRFYLDYPFSCRDCGKSEIWTGPQQKWWHEEIGGQIERIAVRCRACRLKERSRKEEARRIHLDGIAAKSKDPA